MVRTPYRAPTVGIEYNEFVGSLGPYGNGNLVNTELHVRYGVRNGRYFDWAIELVARDGDVDTFRATGVRPDRSVMESVGVVGGAVVRRVRTRPGPEDFETSVVRQLFAGDGGVVDAGYDFNLKQLADQWDQRHEVRGPHAVATFGFARHNRDIGFRDGTYPWVRNTVVCIDDDPGEDTVVERLKAYFPAGGTVAVHCRDLGRMKFLKVGAGSEGRDDAQDDGNNDPLTATGYVSMGMMVDTIYRDEDWIDDTLLP